MSRHSLRGREWNKVCAFVKQRDDYTCQACGTTEDLTVDHIKPLNNLTPDEWADGVPYDPAHLLTLCRTCNGRKKDKVLVRVSWVNDQIRTMLPASHLPAFLRGTGAVPLNADFHANGFKTSDIAANVGGEAA